ncbi:unnamed protein product [Amoebophrya sp. A25]|nr:unnamed protein product [Amoebophrya sp. A25]|eukprot:GSA25T00024109001.1
MPLGMVGELSQLQDWGTDRELVTERTATSTSALTTVGGITTGGTATTPPVLLAAGGGRPSGLEGPLFRPDTQPGIATIDPAAVNAGGFPVGAGAPVLPSIAGSSGNPLTPRGASVHDTTTTSLTGSSRHPGTGYFARGLTIPQLPSSYTGTSLNEVSNPTTTAGTGAATGSSLHAQATLVNGTLAPANVIVNRPQTVTDASGTIGEGRSSRAVIKVPPAPVPGGGGNNIVVPAKIVSAGAAAGGVLEGALSNSSTSRHQAQEHHLQAEQLPDHEPATRATSFAARTRGKDETSETSLHTTAEKTYPESMLRRVPLDNVVFLEEVQQRQEQHQQRVLADEDSGTTGGAAGAPPASSLTQTTTTPGRGGDLQRTGSETVSGPGAGVAPPSGNHHLVPPLPSADGTSPGWTPEKSDSVGVNTASVGDFESPMSTITRIAGQEYGVLGSESTSTNHNIKQNNNATATGGATSSGGAAEVVGATGTGTINAGAASANNLEDRVKNIADSAAAAGLEVGNFYNGSYPSSIAGSTVNNRTVIINGGGGTLQHGGQHLPDPGTASSSAMTRTQLNHIFQDLVSTSDVDRESPDRRMQNHLVQSLFKSSGAGAATTSSSATAGAVVQQGGPQSREQQQPQQPHEGAGDQRQRPQVLERVPTAESSNAATTSTLMDNVLDSDGGPCTARTPTNVASASALDAPGGPSLPPLSFPPATSFPPGATTAVANNNNVAGQAGAPAAPPPGIPQMTPPTTASDSVPPTSTSGAIRHDVAEEQDSMGAWSTNPSTMVNKNAMTTGHLLDRSPREGLDNLFPASSAGILQPCSSSSSNNMLMLGEHQHLLQLQNLSHQSLNYQGPQVGPALATCSSTGVVQQLNSPFPSTSATVHSSVSSPAPIGEERHSRLKEKKEQHKAQQQKESDEQIKKLYEDWA